LFIIYIIIFANENNGLKLYVMPLNIKLTIFFNLKQKEKV